MIGEEMDCTVKYETQRMCDLHERTDELSGGQESSLNAGAVAILQHHYQQSKLRKLETLCWFEGIIRIPPTTQLCVEDRAGPSQVDEDDDSDEYSDNDSDDELSSDNYYDL